MKKVIIQRKFNERNEDWVDISLQQAIHDLESGGYWKSGTSAAMLIQGTELWTPFALYKLKSEKTLSGFAGTSKIEQELRLEIKRHLDKCKKAILPKVHQYIQRVEGYRTIEDRIIQMIIREQITPSAAIAHIETEL